MVAAFPVDRPSPLSATLRRKIDACEGLTAEEAATVRASMTAAEIEEAEAFFGCRVEDLWMDSDMTLADVHASLFPAAGEPCPPR